ncbi:hypothetical protein AMTR_s00019p00250890 [Amborella trichopoda]|uniref:endo-polygalacturonase n=1 Tax=Amborella trichopoda TaxID=13333 RepID=W1PK09_AMBTC|nr:hypothetical protein AMTR_s00019p00250890 [Amborella trichopoda]
MCWGLAGLCGARTLPLSDSTSTSKSFDVMDYGAKGDGMKDDTDAFAKAWNAACSAKGSPEMIIPSGNLFRVGPIQFTGPCESNHVHVTVEGDIVGPPPSSWKGASKETWLVFSHVNGLIVDGSGKIDGHGPAWWAQACRQNKGDICANPTALTVEYSSDVRVSGLNIVNSQQMHMGIEQSTSVTLSHLTIRAPGDSPNTDGIHIQGSSSVTIENCNIGTGDDCISIGPGSSNLNISHIVCGPGHGISIGSLGKGTEKANVQGVHVTDVNMTGTTNGVRIKTWQGGAGTVSDITFERITMDNVDRPIIIDQYYCDSNYRCQNKTSAVQVKGVKFIGVRGTSVRPEAVTLACSKSVACTNILLDGIDLKTVDGEKTVSYCLNAFGSAKGQVIPKPCLD